MIKKSIVFAFAVLLCRSLAGADVKDFAEYAFLSQYKSIEIARVTDGTGNKLKSAILEKAQGEIQQALKRRGYPVVMRGDTPDPNKTLLIEARITKYSGGLGSAFGLAESVGSGDSVGGSGVSFFVRFKDKKLDAELGTVKVSRGGFSKDGNLVKTCDALAEIMKKKEYDEEGKRPLPIPVQFGGSYGGSSSQRSGPMSIAPGSNIAVISFSTKDVTGGEAEIITELIRTEIVNMGIGFYNVLDRQYVDKVMGEHAFAATGLTSSEGAANIGKMLNAQKVVTGSVTKMMDSYFLTANMIDVETGKIESAASGDYKTAEDMKQTAAIVANKLVRLR